jgi:hypothetical protein
MPFLAISEGVSKSERRVQPKHFRSFACLAENVSQFWFWKAPFTGMAECPIRLVEVYPFRP